jgi:hypothetical protein
MRPDLQLIGLATLLLAAPSRFEVRPGDPHAVTRPSHRCDPEADPVWPDKEPPLPYDIALSSDGCTRKRAFAFGTGQRNEYWSFYNAPDGGLGLEPTEVDLIQKGYFVSAKAYANGVFNEVKVSDYSADGGFVRAVTLSNNGGVQHRLTATATTGELEEIREEHLTDAGWLLDDSYESSRVCRHKQVPQIAPPSK